MPRGSGQRKWQPRRRAQSILWLTALAVKPHFARARAGKILIAAVLKWLDQPRTLLKGGEGPITMTFCQVGNAVLKVCSQSSSGDLVYNVARNVVN
jgi:hypothetical protein